MESIYRVAPSLTGLNAVRRSGSRTRQWVAPTSGGRAAAGNGTFLRGLRSILRAKFTYRDVAAGICILEEAGGLMTTANPPPDPETAEIGRPGLGSRLYLAIR